MNVKAGVFKCAVCGTQYEINEVSSLTVRQRGIRDAIEQLRRDYGRLPITREISNHLVTQGANYPASAETVKNELTEMEKRHILHRPNGPRSGWALRGLESIALVKVEH